MLEFGCAAGSNLAAMAVTLPEARFHGIDLSVTQIEQGRGEMAASGLRNVHLQAADILDVDLGDTRYDYIVAHGVFSWVPDPVRERLFELVRRHLAPTGVAYISYNTLPGWTVNEAVAEMLRLETEGHADTETRLRAARDSLALFGELFDGASGAHVELVRHELEHIGGKDPVVFLHDELEATSDPCYFLQFVAWAGEHELRHFTDAKLPSLWPRALPKETLRMLAARGLPWLKAQQYLDYLQWRRFRRSLLCHADALCDELPAPQRLDSLVVETRLRPVGDISVAPGLPLRYRLAGDGPEAREVMQVTDPLIQAFMHRLLGISPRSRLFREVLDDAMRDAGGKASEPSRVAILRDWVMVNIARGWMDVSVASRMA
ncbi:MAG: methyltransferase domain-containing protein [Gammaproteobacteria bacterium]|nr:methyltransferase domain-containing protein [Gammaproteobacteria bacterium]